MYNFRVGRRGSEVSKTAFVLKNLLMPFNDSLLILNSSCKIKQFRVRLMTLVEAVVN